MLLFVGLSITKIEDTVCKHAFNVVDNSSVNSIVFKITLSNEPLFTLKASSFCLEMSLSCHPHVRLTDIGSHAYKCAICKHCITLLTSKLNIALSTCTEERELCVHNYIK